MEYLQYIIPAAALIIVQLIISYRQQSINDVKTDMLIGEIKKDIARLEQAQVKHNNLIERVVILEENEKAQWRRIDEFKEKMI